MSEMEQVKVLTAWFSPFGMRVVIALEEKDVKYEHQEENLYNKTDLLLQMNPVQKKVPVLIHNGKPICESLVILHYIEEVWDSKPFLPSEPYDRALARFWADFIDKKFFDSAFRILKSKEEALEEAKHDMLESIQLLEGTFKEMSAGGSLPFFSGLLEMAQVKVLNARFSVFGMRVLIALEEKGVKYEYQEEVLANKSELLLKMNPVHNKIPVLIHNGHPICESLMIVQYIDEVWDSTQFLPSKPYDRALARFWADFTDKKFYDAGARVLGSKDEAQEQAKRELLECFQLLEGALKELSAGGTLPFFNGKDFGFLDIAFITFASWFHATETLGNFKIPFDSEYPLLDAWVKRCMERESVKKVLPPPDQVLENVIKMRKRILGE